MAFLKITITCEFLATREVACLHYSGSSLKQEHGAHGRNEYTEKCFYSVFPIREIRVFRVLRVPTHNKM